MTPRRGCRRRGERVGAGGTSPAAGTEGAAGGENCASVRKRFAEECARLRATPSGLERPLLMSRAPVNHCLLWSGERVQWVAQLGFLQAEPDRERGVGVSDGHRAQALVGGRLCWVLGPAEHGMCSCGGPRRPSGTGMWKRPSLTPVSPLLSPPVPTGEAATVVRQP